VKLPAVKRGVKADEIADIKGRLEKLQ